MIQFISFSEMNNTYSYRIQLTNDNSAFQWELSFAQHGVLMSMQSGVAGSLQDAFKNAFQYLSITASTTSIQPISHKVQYMVSNGMMTESNIASALFAESFNPTSISWY